jgi:steroid delta-isomerase-like uncharacterized protein
VSRSVLEAFTTGNFDVYDEVLAPDFVDHDPQSPFAAARRGPQVMRATAILYRTAFPDLLVVIEAQYEAGDVIITRWTVSGTQTGGLPGLPPTRKRAAVSGVQIDRFKDDTIVESWRYWDTLGMLQQLGAVPPRRVRRPTEVVRTPGGRLSAGRARRDGAPRGTRGTARSRCAPARARGS